MVTRKSEKNTTECLDFPSLAQKYYFPSIVLHGIYPSRSVCAIKICHIRLRLSTVACMNISQILSLFGPDYIFILYIQHYILTLNVVNIL